MHYRNGLSALIGLLFMFAPWWFQFGHVEGVVTSSLIAGFIQLAASLLAIGKTGWNSWQNWLALLAGVWFIIFPLAYMLDLLLSVMYIALGITTVLLNYFNMNHEVE
ncbi:SPW repeat protein [Paenibacillus sp. P26]|nr:SPW repeat protein [Paenibacillus sp. P26]UUZ95587.1 SPW repeat protein [Paenibacillus sp. P25]